MTRAEFEFWTARYLAARRAWLMECEPAALDRLRQAERVLGPMWSA